jgi:hypothetical protein
MYDYENTYKKQNLYCDHTMKIAYILMTIIKKIYINLSGPREQNGKILFR